MRKSFVRTLQIGLATLVAMVGLGVAAAPAQASATCASGNLCVWTGAQQTGSKKTMSLSPGTCARQYAPWDNSISSFENASSSAYYLYTKENCTISPGAVIIVYPGERYTQLDYTFNNTISSIERAS